MKDFENMFKGIIEKQGSNENISVELDTLITATRELINEHEQLETKYNDSQDYITKLKDANTNLLLSKGFVRDFGNPQVKEEEQNKNEPFDIKNYMDME